MVANDKLEHAAATLWGRLYEEPFRGKPRGRFALSRDQLRQALGVQRLHPSTLARFQDVALAKGLVVVDLDDLFPCIEVRIVRKYRRPPQDLFDGYFPILADDAAQDEEDD